MRKEIVAMLLAGGQGSRLGVLTKNGAKPAVSFGGKYRIIDFPLSNCINSGIDTVGVLTQYQPLLLNSHIGIGIAWDLDRNYGGVRILPPYEKDAGSEWYTGTANAIYQNISYIDSYDPEYVLILSGDHIYKMDYEHMLDYHKKKEADLTIAAMVVDINEASRFGILVTDSDGRIIEFEEKPENPSSNIASMGIYIFNWKKLKKALCTLSDIHGLDFGKHVIPYLHENYAKIYSYKFRGYWKDVGTLESYWHANMELIDIVPEFNLYQEFWRIYTNSETIKPQYMCENASISKSIISDGCEICGEVHSSVLGNNVIVGHNSAISNSIIMDGVKIGDGCVIEKAIIAENTTIENGVKIGLLDSKPNQEMPHIYNNDIAVIGEKSYIPEGVEIGKNTALMGETTCEDYIENRLESGQNLIKEAKI